MGEIYTARNTERFTSKLRFHEGIPDRYRVGYAPPRVASPAEMQSARKAVSRMVIQQARLMHRTAVMRDGTPSQRVIYLLLSRLQGIREAESPTAMQRRYFGALDMINLAHVGETITLAGADRLQKLAFNASDYRARELSNDRND